MIASGRAVGDDKLRILMMEDLASDAGIELRDLLHKPGCCQVQGYRVSRPAPEEEILKMRRSA
jgi:hypothetical protein